MKVVNSGNNIERKQVHRTRTEINRICFETSKLRTKGLTYNECAAYLKIPVKTIERYYPEWSARQYDQKKADWKKFVDEFIERQEEIIKQAEMMKDLKTKNRANADLFDRLQAAGFVPKAKELIEYSGQISVSATDLLKKLKQEMEDYEKEETATSD